MSAGKKKRKRSIIERVKSAKQARFEGVGGIRGTSVGRTENDNRLDLTAQVILGQDRLPRNLEVRNLDVDAGELLRQGVDLDESRVDGLVELAEASD